MFRYDGLFGRFGRSRAHQFALIFPPRMAARRPSHSGSRVILKNVRRDVGSYLAGIEA